MGRNITVKRRVTTLKRGAGRINFGFVEKPNMRVGRKMVKRDIIKR